MYIAIVYSFCIQLLYLAIVYGYCIYKLVVVSELAKITKKLHLLNFFFSE